MTARTSPRDADASATRWLVRAVVFAFAGALVTAATLYPTYRAPDEPAHVDQARAIRSSWSVPGLGERQLSRQVVESYPLVGYLSGVPGEAPPLGATSAPPRPERPSFPDIAPDEPSTLGNQMAQHPPLYYLLAAAWLVPLDTIGPVAFDLEVWWLRLLGVLLVAPLPWLAARTAERLQLGSPAVGAAATAVLGVPMLVHIGSSVNNDTLLVALAGVVTLHAGAMVSGDLTVRRAVWLGGATAAALLTKAFALALLPLVAAAAVVAWSRTPERRREAVVAGATALGVALVAGGWWWARNLLVHGTVQPGGAPSPAPPDGFAPDLGWWAPFLVGRLVRRWWIEPDTVARTTPPLLVLATVVALGLLAAGLLRRRGRRRELLTLLLPVAGCLAMVLVGGWRAYARTGIPFAIHGRYLYPGLVGAAVVVAAGAASLLRDRAPALLLAGAVLLQVTAAWWALTFYWGVPDVTAPLASLRAWLAWSPLPPVPTLAPAFAAAGGTIAAAVLAWRPGGRRLPRR